MVRLAGHGGDKHSLLALFEGNLEAVSSIDCSADSRPLQHIEQKAIARRDIWRDEAPFNAPLHDEDAQNLLIVDLLLAEIGK